MAAANLEGAALQLGDGRVREAALEIEEIARIAEREWALLGESIPTTEEGRSLALREPHLRNLRAAVDAANATVLGVLLEGSRLGGFNVTTRDADWMYIDSIDKHEARGDCGWIWYRNGDDKGHAAKLEPVTTGDVIRWAWGCAGVH